MFWSRQPSIDDHLRALGDSRRAPREAAVKALAETGEDVDNRLVAALAAGATPAARVLMLRDARSVAGALVPLVHSEQELVAQAALGLLLRFGAEQELDALEASGGRAGERVGAARATPQPHAGDWPQWLAALDQGAPEQAGALRAMLDAESAPPEPLLDRLLGLLQGQDVVAEPAGLLLVRHHPERALEPLLAALAAGRWPAARALGALGDPAAVPGLIEALNHEATASVAAQALGRLGDPRAIEPLRALLKRHRPVARPPGEPDAADLARQALSLLGAAP